MTADPMDEMDKRPRMTACGDAIVWRPDAGGWQDEDLPELGDIWPTLASMPDPLCASSIRMATSSPPPPQEPADPTPGGQ